MSKSGHSKTVYSNLQDSNRMEIPNSANKPHSFDKDFHDIVSDENILRRTAEKFLYNLIDDVTLGIIFDVHRKFKTKGFSTDPSDYPVSSENFDILAQPNIKKNRQLCVCPICDRTVDAAVFAPHLASCMGMGRPARSLRNSIRTPGKSKVKENAGNYSMAASDDDDDDADWNPSKKNNRRKKGKKEKSKSKRRKGSPSGDLESTESGDIDIEADEDSDSSNLRGFLQVCTNGSSSPDHSPNGDRKKAKKNFK